MNLEVIWGIGFGESIWQAVAEKGGTQESLKGRWGSLRLEWWQQGWDEWPPAPLRGRGPATQGLENRRRGLHNCKGFSGLCPGQSWGCPMPSPGTTPQTAAVPKTRKCVCVCVCVCVCPKKLCPNPTVLYSILISFLDFWTFSFKNT